VIVKSRIFNCLHHLRVVEISLDLALNISSSSFTALNPLPCILVAPFAVVIVAVVVSVVVVSWTLLVMGL